MSSTTSLVRSPSAPTSFGVSHSSPKPSTPASATKTVLPQLNPTPNTKSTPSQIPTPQPSTPGTSTPGQWQHPRMQEVLQRQNKNNFDRRNVWAVTINAVALILSFTAPAFIYPLLSTTTLRSFRPCDTYALLLFRAFFASNIVLAILPLLRAKDNCEDIPLTPAQRHLLGLPPMSRPATPQEKDQWITPPRYTRSRSATPRSPASSLRAQASGSPGSGSLFGGTPQRENSNSPFSTSQLSPSLRNGPAAGGERRRLSYNATRSSPLGASDLDTDVRTGLPAKDNLTMDAGLTPLRKGNRASVGLNSKWLYEKGMGMGGKGSPRRGSNGGGAWDPQGWGTGSVFN